MHRIHLRGPWAVESEDGSTSTVQFPLDLQATPDLHGPVRLVRHFNWPANLAADERVFVVLENWKAAARVTVNGVELDAPHDATHLLRFRNVLTIEIDDFGPNVGTVSLGVGNAAPDL